MATLVANGHSKKETVVLGEIVQAWLDIQMTAWLNTVKVGGLGGCGLGWGIGLSTLERKAFRLGFLQ